MLSFAYHGRSRVIHYHLRTIGGYKRVGGIFAILRNNQVLKSKLRPGRALWRMLNHSGGLIVDDPIIMLNACLKRINHSDYKAGTLFGSGIDPIHARPGHYSGRESIRFMHCIGDGWDWWGRVVQPWYPLWKVLIWLEGVNSLFKNSANSLEQEVSK